jgi:hypothetical protein
MQSIMIAMAEALLACIALCIRGPEMERHAAGEWRHEAEELRGVESQRMAAQSAALSRRGIGANLNVLRIGIGFRRASTRRR